LKTNRKPSLAYAIVLAALLQACGNSTPTGVDRSTPPGATPLPPADSNLSQYVVPLTGTFPPGFVNPGPVQPFGMVQLGPDTEGPINYGGYSYNNLLVTGFSHVHMSAGVFKGGQIPLMPVAGEVTAGDLPLYPGPVPGYASLFTHLGETAEAGYYAVDLLRYRIKAELTATERAGLHRYTYPSGQTPRVVVAVGRELAGRRPATAVLRPDGTLTGSVDSSDNYKLYFAARFSAPYTAQVLGADALAPNQEAAADDLSIALAFTNLSGPLLAKVGISYVDADGALRNLDAEIPDWDFDAVRAQARAKWDEALARITVAGGTLAERQSFYTALSRAQQFPNLLSDVDGRYPGPDDRIHQGTHPHYSQFSLWDSYRGQNQLLAEIAPDIYRDMVGSLLDFHRQSGALPRWQQAQRDAAHMSGDPAIPFIVEALCRGLIAPDQQTGLIDAMLSLADKRAAEIHLGYAPVPEPANLLEQIAGGPRQAGTTLEYGIADFALALATGDEAIAQRSLNYRNLLDADTGFIRPRHEDGRWLSPFLPELGYGFQEGTSWQYSWLAMHDYAGLIERMGGAGAVQQRLDLFFGYPLNALPLVVPTLQNAITAFGTTYYGNQYAPGNEHDLEAPYVYSYLGMPWRTALTSRTAASIYTPTPLGLPGNDDLGALSGWLVWTMLGVYPINPGTPLYLIGSPHFSKATLHRPSGDFFIAAPGASLLNQFVVGASLGDGDSIGSWFVMPRTATTLDLATRSWPDMNWGSAHDELPPSLSIRSPDAFGCQR
jgi:predicted alpha-1,2-mannosidase